jgi:hypothetical protein
VVSSGAARATSPRSTTVTFCANCWRLAALDPSHPPPEFQQAPDRRQSAAYPGQVHRFEQPARLPPEHVRHQQEDQSAPQAGVPAQTTHRPEMNQRMPALMTKRKCPGRFAVGCLSSFYRNHFISDAFPFPRAGNQKSAGGDSSPCLNCLSCEQRSSDALPVAARETFGRASGKVRRPCHSAPEPQQALRSPALETHWTNLLVTGSS